MKTLYVTDLDGTLLNTQERVSEYSSCIINNLVEKGMLFTYATARSLSSASIVAAGLSTRIPVIVYNGAFILKPDTQEILYSVGFSEEERVAVQQRLAAQGISPLVYAYIEGVEKVSWDTTKENYGIRRYLDKRKNDKRMRPLADSSGLYDGEPFYFTCIGEWEELVPAYELFKADERYTCTFQQEIYRTEYWLEIMPRKATKANAIKKLKEMWNCDRIVSFGDAMNDIPMFQISDECYAVANAAEPLKALATGIIGSNEEDAVAKWLAEHAICDLFANKNV